MSKIYFLNNILKTVVHGLPIGELLEVAAKKGKFKRYLFI